jgi:hypothetical protein
MLRQNPSGLTISRLGVPTDKEALTFPNSILTNVVFSNVITPNFTEQQVYGRNEPLVVYKNTTRTVNFSFTVVSDTESIRNINKFQRMVYPLYDNNNLMVGTPIFKIRYNNLLYDPFTDDGIIGIIKDLNVGEQFTYGKVLVGEGDNAVGIGGQGTTAVPSLTTKIEDESSIISYASM